MAPDNPEDDRIELVRRLFVLATEVAESAHETAVLGQSVKDQAADYAAAAEGLVRLADALKTIGSTVQIAVTTDKELAHLTKYP